MNTITLQADTSAIDLKSSNSSVAVDSSPEESREVIAVLDDLKPIADYCEQVEKTTDLRKLGEIFRTIIRHSNQINYNLLKCRSEPTKTLPTLQDRIVKKAHELNFLPVNFFPILHKISIPMPLSIYPFFVGSQWNGTLTDIADYQLSNLKTCLIVKKSKQKYEQLTKNWNTALPLPAELINWKSEELTHLFQNSNYDSRSPFVNHLNCITDQIIRNEPEAERKGRELLEKAIIANCPNTVSYLLSIIDINLHPSFFEEKDLFALAANIPIIPVLNEESEAKKMKIYSALYDARHPLSAASFSAIIFETLQHCFAPTNAENNKKNNILFDLVLNSLLGVKEPKNIIQLIKGFPKQIGHMLDLKGELYESHEFADHIWLHLRLFFQKIIETIQLSGEIHQKVIDEFLCELETGWIIFQIPQWHSKYSNEKGKFLNERGEFLIENSLVNYILQQICNLSPGVEYVIPVELPLHAIYVAFNKLGNDLEIRIDNLGGFSEKRDRHVTTVSLNDYSQSIKAYITYLLEVTACCYSNRTWFKSLLNDKNKEQQFWKTGNEFATRIYSPKEFQFPDPNPRKSYPDVGNQTVGNCVHYSFLLGQRIRLNDQDREFFPPLVALMTKIEHQLKNNHTQVQSDLKSFPYNIWLCRKLLNKYFILEGNASSVPLMRCRILENKSILNDLLSKNGKCRMFIEGAAGVGKTTFSQQLALQLQSSAKLASVVFYLPLRDLLKHNNPAKLNLLGLVESYILKRELPFYEKTLMEKLINDSTTIWILDGLDELIIPQSLEEAITELFQRQRLIITSRPHFSAKHLKGITDSDLTQFTRFEISDYEIEKKEQLIQYYFSLNQNPEYAKSKDELVSILKDSNSNAYLKKVCEIPLSLSHICELLTFGHSEILQETNAARVTEIFVDSLMMNAYKKNHKNPKSHEIIKKEKYSSATTCMEKLAFSSLKEKRNTFFSLEIKNQVLPKDENLRELLQKNLKEIGLLQIDEGGGQFIHATYQEYFTARYLIAGLQHQEYKTEYKEARKFILDHRNSSQYDQVFLYVAQIFKAKIEQSKGDEHLNEFVVFLKVYFSKTVESPETIPPTLESPLISLIEITYEIAEKAQEDQLKTLIVTQINPLVKDILKNIKFGIYISTAKELQKLILNRPHLKLDLELPSIIIQTFTEFEKEKAPQKINWILDFINTFEISMNLTFLLQISNNCQYLHVQIDKVLKAVELSSELSKNVSVDDYLDGIKKLLQIALCSYNVSKHFPVVEHLCIKLGGKIDLSYLLTKVVKGLVEKHSGPFGNSELANFIRFIKERKPHDHMDSALLDYIVDCLVKSKFQSIVFDFTHFLISYTCKLASTKNADQLKIMPERFSKIFNFYNPSSECPFLSWNSFQGWNDHYEMLKTMQHQQHPSLNLIFNHWDDTIVQKDFSIIIKTLPLPNIISFLKNPPVIQRFVFTQDMGKKIKERIICIAKASVQENKKDNPNRTSNWREIHAFLADKKIIDRLDSRDPNFVDEILATLIGLFPKNAHANSGLPLEILEALTGYQEKLPQKSSRMASIEQLLNQNQKYLKILKAEEGLQSIQKPNSDTLEMSLEFTFDFSYCGYSDTLLQLKLLVLKNPIWIQNLISQSKRLEELKEILIIEEKAITGVDANTKRLEKKKAELAIVIDLIQKCKEFKKVVTQQ